MKTKFQMLIIMSAVLFAGACKKTTTTTTTADTRPRDYDGNVYDTVKIGTQVWMVQNLKTAHYNDGTVIPTGLSDVDWSANTSGAYAVYNNNDSNNIAYGKLYNWYAVNTGKLAPTGWHVPTDAEWGILLSYLGGEAVAGGAMKALTLWNSPNVGATNSSGFTGLPGGSRNYNSGAYNEIGKFGDFWSTTAYNTDDGLYCELNQGPTTYRTNFSKNSGFSVRCVRN